MENNKTKVIQFRVNEDTYNETRDKAEQDGRTVSNLMQKLLTDYLESTDKK